MAAVIIEGKAIAAKVNEETRERAAALKARGITPCLAVVLVGDNPASVSYVRGKQKALVELGMTGKDIRLPGTTSEIELLSLIDSLNTDNKVHGILIQLPLPSGSSISEERIFTALNPRKDVDSLHPVSLGKLLRGEPGFLPCTPHGILVTLRELGIPLAGSHVVIVGRSNIVGKPLAQLFIRREQNATVTVCHTGTKDLAFHTRQADVLVAAAGSYGLISGDMIKKGAVVIDVGVNRVPDASAKQGYRLKGDVNFDEALETAGWITKVPGGVGPMTIAMLMRNVVEAAENS